MKEKSRRILILAEGLFSPLKSKTANGAILKRIIRFHEEVVEFFRPTKVVAVGINSVGLSDEEPRSWSKKIEQETGLPTVDAFRFGGAPIADALLTYLQNGK